MLLIALSLSEREGGGGGRGDVKEAGVIGKRQSALHSADYCFVTEMAGRREGVRESSKQTKVRRGIEVSKCA